MPGPAGGSKHGVIVAAETLNPGVRKPRMPDVIFESSSVAEILFTKDKADGRWYDMYVPERG